jgi:ligand-binding sensor domain-containing protein/signal transduction histidine kinase
MSTHLRMRRRFHASSVCLAIGIALMLSTTGRAERPPVRVYTVTDGLAHDRVYSILADSRGFLWFSTVNGISRFDGTRFVNYGSQDGLPTSSVSSIVELPNGEYLVATNGGGIGKYAPERAADRTSRFQMFPIAPDTAANRVNVLLRAGERLWAGTDAGLYEVVDEGHALRVDHVPLDEAGGTRVQVIALGEDARGRLWIGTSRGLCVIDRPGTPVCQRIAGASTATPVRTLLADPGRGMWVGHDAGLSLIDVLPDGGTNGRPPTTALFEKQRYRQRDGLPHDRVNALLRAADGSIVIGTMQGLTRLAGSTLSSRGLPSSAVQALTVDRDGHVWIAVVAGGVARLSAHGLTSYTVEDGLANPYVQDVLETRAGTIAVVTRDRALSVFDGHRFDPVRPPLPPMAAGSTPVRHFAFLEDRDGGWWVRAGAGLLRYPPLRGVGDLAHTKPSAVYTERDGLAAGEIWRLFEDSRGDVWIATRAPGTDVVTRWDRASRTFHRYSDAHGLPAHNPAAAFVEDRAGNIWVGFWEGGAARFRGGRFERLPGFDQPLIDWLAAKDGTLWGASLGGGLLRIDDPGAPAPKVTIIGTNDGLPGDRFVAVAEDDYGRLYLGSPVGITRLDPKSGAIRHYTQEDGLARNEVKTAFRDRTGTLWFGTDAGVSRLAPEAPGPRETARLLIGGARVNGAALPISDLGTASAGPFTLDPTQRHVEIDFLSLGVNQAPGIAFRLVGAETEWTAANGRRSVNYARLASGSYRFVVRAPDGDRWTEASLAFDIRPPLWQRGWVIASAGALVVLGLFAAHRTRVAHVTAVERVRTRIASDLHDDIGTNLSQIAILGELATRHGGDAPRSASLARIAELSRESVDSLGDIVWSIDPDKDHLSNLTMRMRRLASDLLSARDIEFTFEVHGSPDLAVGADVRRNVFLAFKETLNNVVRHADCRSVRVDVRMDRGQLAFTVADDGRGFDAARVSGHGLTSLRQRAERFGGTLTVSSTPAGTTVVMNVPRRPRHIPT